MSDLISRQAAISAICNACGKIDCDKMDKCEKLQLPPANCSEFPNNSDTISRQAAIDALNNIEIPRNASWYQYYQQALTAVDKLPPAQPEIVPCNYVEACNVATMDKSISAYTYLSVLADLKDHGFVLVDMREVTI